MFHMQVFTLPLTWKNLLFMKVEPQHTIVAQRNTYTWFSYFCYAYWQRRHTNTYKFQPCFFNPNFQFILYFSERTTYFQLLEWICILNEEQARAKKSTWIVPQIHADPLRGVRLIRLNQLTSKIVNTEFMFQLILTREKANVFFEDANEHNWKIQFANQLDKWKKVLFVQQKNTILMKPNIIEGIDWFRFCHTGDFHLLNHNYFDELKCMCIEKSNQKVISF